MKKLVTLAIAALCTFALQAQYGGITYDWAKKIGQSTGSGNDNVRGIAVSNGYVYIVGGFQSTVDFDPGAGTANLVSTGSNDIFVAKYTTQGDYVWANRIGGLSDDYGLSLVLGENDTVIIAGYYGGTVPVDFDPGANTSTLANGGGVDGFIAKYDPSGNYVWARRITGTLSDYAYGLALDTNNNIFVCGTVGSTNVTFEHPFSPAVQVNFTDPADMYFAKYDQTGRCLYARGFQGGATADVVAREIAIDANNDVYITGQFIGTCDFNAGAGTALLSASVNTDVFLTKYTNAGDYVWVRAMGGTTTTPNQYDNAFSLDFTPSGNIIVAGAYWGTGSFNGQQVTAQGSSIAGFFASYTPAGVCNWAKGISGTGTSNQAQVYKTTHDAEGNIYVTGRFLGNAVDFDVSAAFYNVASVPGNANDIFIAKYDSSGNFIWVNRMGSSTTDEAFVMYMGDSSKIYLGGYFSGTADFDPGSGTQNVVASSGNDGFIARYTLCGLPAATASISGPDTVCVSLTGTVYTAAPVAGATSYIWTLPAGWSGTSTTNSIAVTSNTTSGTISVRAVNDCGPSLPTSKTITLVPGPSAAPTAITGGATSPCIGAVHTYTASGGTGGTRYVWNIPAGVTIIGASDSVNIVLQMPLTTGTVNIGVARANDCDTTTFATQTLTIRAIADGTVSPASPTVCAGSSVTLSASVFSPGTYTWSNSLGTGASKTVSPANTTTYTVTMTTTSGLCPDVDTVTVTVVPAVTAAISPATVVTCSGQPTTLTASGGTTYAWSNSGGSNAQATFSPTTNTTYTVTVSDGNCSATASRLVTVNANPTAAITPATVTICNGQSATLTASGGTTYAWSNGGGSNAAATFSPTSTTTYTVTVTNANGCTATASRTVNVNALPAAAVSPSATAICNGQSATLTASGGGTYAWSNSGGSNAAATFSPTVTTTYTVTVTGANTCTATATATVTVNQLPAAVIQPATVTICNGQSATLTASGGTTYAWSNSGGSNAQATFSPTTNTTYTVTVIDGNNCSATASKLVTVNSNPTAVVQPATTAVCAGNTTTLTASGGTAYAWSNSGGSNAQATFSPATNTTYYTVTVTNANNCTATATATVSVNQLPTAAIQPATVTICNGQSATLTASGGTAYAWSNSGGSNAQATFSPATNTTYTVTVTDGNNCSATASRLVTVNAVPTATVTPSSTAICEGSSATLTAGGGTAYAWSNSGGSNAAATFSPTLTTTYTVTVTNANNCSATASGTITVNPIPAAAINGPTTICSGLSATLTASGGGTYAWANGLGSNAAITVTPTNTTTYTVTVTGAGNCTATASQTVSVQSSPTATISGPTALCIGDSITLTANGGNTYAWSNGAATSSIKVSPATATTYNVTVSIGANCSATATQSVAVNSLPTAAIQPAATTICEGNSATLTASGNGNYSWSNSGGSNAQATFSPASTTTYTVTVTNANNCTATASATVTVNSNPTAAVNPSGIAVCAGGSTALTASGGNQYAWSNNATAAQINVTPANTTTYTVTVTNAANCTATASATVTVYPIPAAAISGDNAICAGGSATLTATGGGTYQWSNNGGSNAQAVFTPAATTTYTVTVTGTGNCTATASQGVIVTTVTAAVNGPTTICAGLSATLTASGGGTYSWSTTETTAAITVTPVSATTYTVTVTNNNCTATASQSVSVQNAPTASISGSTTVCAGESVQLTANGGNTYSWSDNLGSNATVSVSPAATTTYTVTASLGDNCTASASQTVSVLQPTASAFSQTICSGEQFIFDGNTLTTGGTYTQTLVNAAGCDSVITLTLTVLAPVTSSVSQSICAGTSYDFNGEVLTQAGTYYDTLSNVQGCDSIVALTLAVLAPVTSSYTDNICAGGTYDFNGETLTQAGVYYDTLVSAQSCDSIVTLNLLLADTPQITQQPTVNNATVCAGATVTLSVSASGNGLSYQWKESGNSEGPDADTYTTAALTAGNKSYSVEVSNSCGTTQANTVAVTVNALPVPVITQAGAVLSTQTFSQYQWQLGGTDINGATAQSYTAVANGDYTVAVVDANGCEATSAVLNVTGVGIAEEEQLAISVYPNPAADVLIVQTALPLSKIEVYSVAGTNVFTAEGNIRLLDVSTLAQGNYTIKLTALHGNTVLKRFAKM